MAHQLTWSPRAQRQLDELLQYVAGHDSRMAADHLEADLHRTVELLRHTPMMGAYYEKARHKKLREIFCHRIRIFYRVFKSREHVEVVSLWHGSRKEPEFL